MGSRPSRVGQTGWLLLLATLLQGTTAWAQGTVCHRVWVEVRDNDLMGNSEMTAPPRTRYPGKFCFIVYDRRTARFSLEPDDPSAKPFASLVLRRSRRDAGATLVSYGRSSPDYNEDQIRGRNDFLYLRTYPNGERHYGATVTDLTGKITLSWSATVGPRGARLDEVPSSRNAQTATAQVSAGSPRRQPPGPQ
ncbi:MAG TPA: hypothetical protein VLT82_13175 [Myxococcaceae bacterium]|nr:hypothetical protein [Myxococcaceae bacterium]